MEEALDQFIRANPDPRELKRAIATQMYLKGFKHREIIESIGVTSGFISKWTQRYQDDGVAGLKLGYQGSLGYLTPEQRQAILTWLQERDHWNLIELQQHVKDQYQVMFASKQSYYELFEQAGISWKKSQKRNPKADPQQVSAKKKK